MLWARESAKVGLAHSHHRKQQGGGARLLKCFQDMPDPLNQEIKIKGPDDIPMVSVSAYINTACYVYSTVQYIEFNLLHVMSVNMAHCVYSTVHCILN